MPTPKKNTKCRSYADFERIYYPKSVAERSKSGGDVASQKQGLKLAVNFIENIKRDLSGKRK